MAYPADFKYTKEHEWIKADRPARSASRDHAQDSLGDIVFVELPKVGTELTHGQSLRHGRVGEGRLRSLRSRLRDGDGSQRRAGDGPGEVNKDAHGAWMVKVTLKDPAEMNALLSAADYEKFVAEEARTLKIAEFDRLQNPGCTIHASELLRAESGFGLTAIVSRICLDTSNIPMRYLPKSPADRQAMLQAIGVALHRRLVLADSRRSIASTAISRSRARWRSRKSSTGSGSAPAKTGDGYAHVSRRRRLPPLPARSSSTPDLARRVLHRLHPVSGRDRAGHAAVHLRVPDHDLRAHRHGSGQRLHVRRLDRRSRSRDDGVRASPGEAVGGRRAQPASRVSRGAGHLRDPSGDAPDRRSVHRRGAHRSEGTRDRQWATIPRAS